MKKKNSEEIAKKITKDTGILDAIEKNPKVAEFLFEMGLACIGCPHAGFETIEQGLRAHGFENNEINQIIEDLNK